jgi:hypothetical protein
MVLNKDMDRLYLNLVKFIKDSLKMIKFLEMESIMSIIVCYMKGNLNKEKLMDKE